MSARYKFFASCFRPERHVKQKYIIYNAPLIHLLLIQLKVILHVYTSIFRWHAVDRVASIMLMVHTEYTCYGQFSCRLTPSILSQQDIRKLSFFCRLLTYETIYSMLTIDN